MSIIDDFYFVHSSLCKDDFCGFKQRRRWSAQIQAEIEVGEVFTYIKRQR